MTNPSDAKIEATMRDLAEYAVQDTDWSRVGASSPKRNPRRFGGLVLGTVAIALIAVAMLVVRDRDETSVASVASSSTTAQPAAIRNATTTTTSVSTSAAVAAGEVATPAGEPAVRLILSRDGFVLAQDTEAETQAPTSPAEQFVGLIVETEIPFPEGPAAFITARPVDPSNREPGAKVTASNGTTGLLTGHDDTGQYLTWTIESTQISVTTNGFDRDTVIEFMARIGLDPVSMNRPAFSELDTDELHVSLEAPIERNERSTTVYCGPSGGITFIIRDGGRFEAISHFFPSGQPVIEHTTSYGTWLVAHRNETNAIATLDTGGAVIVAFVNSQSITELLDGSRPVGQTEWDRYIADRGPIPSEPRACSIDSEGQPVARGPLSRGAINHDNPLTITPCDGASDEVPAFKSGTIDAIHRPTAPEAVLAYAESWRPSVDGTNNMPTEGWWVRLGTASQITYAWAAGDPIDLPNEFNIVLHLERSDAGWAVTRWESSGC